MYRASRPDMKWNGLVHDTRDQAIDSVSAGEQFPITVELLRKPRLDDFITGDDMASIMRERMAARIGNDNALSDPGIAEYVISTIEERKGEWFSELGELEFDGYIVMAREKINGPDTEGS